MTAVQSLVADMVAEGESLDSLVADLDDDIWRRPTPAVGWTIAHQIGHLSWTDRVATLSAADPDAFADVLTTGAADPAGFVDTAAEQAAADAPGDILATWRANRSALATALVAVPAGTRLSWFGPPMSAASMATARIMETWAHGLDVADTLGVPVVPSARIRSVAHIGVRTRDFAYIVNGRTPPATPLRVELASPDGQIWEWGPADAENRVSGPAVDFCQLVTQRRALADLELTITGPDAAEWSTIAQAFAGAPDPGRASSAATTTAVGR